MVTMARPSLEDGVIKPVYHQLRPHWHFNKCQRRQREVERQEVVQFQEGATNPPLS